MTRHISCVPAIEVFRITGHFYLLYIQKATMLVHDHHGFKVKKSDMDIVLLEVKH